MDPMTIMSALGMAGNMFGGGGNNSNSSSGGSNLLGGLLAGIPSLLSGIFSITEGRRDAKLRQKAIDKMLSNAPKFNDHQNPIFGYSTSPQQDMLNFGMMNSLISTLAPSAGLNFGDGFADLWGQYSPAEYAGFNQVNPQNISRGAGANGMMPNPNPTNQGTMPANPFEDMLHSRLIQAR